MPPGYRLVERSRTGLIVAGAIVVGVPYVIGLSFATRSNGSNGAAWLLVPGIGPWLAIGARRDACDRANVDGSLACAADVLATTGLVFDGLIQTTGAVLLIVGLTVPKKVLVRQDVAAKLKLAPVGSGYGLAAVGTF